MTPEMVILFDTGLPCDVFDKKYAADNPEIPEPITAIFINKNYAASSLYSSIDGHEQTRFRSP